MKIPFSLAELKLVDAPPEKAYDDLTELAAKMLAVPLALVTIIDTERKRQYFKSIYDPSAMWAGAQEAPLAHSFSKHVVKRNAPLAIEDAVGHPLVRDRDATVYRGVGSYLGVPVHGPDGGAIGALCVADRVPRRWSEADAANLIGFAKCVSDAIRLKVARLTSEALREEQREFTYSISHDLKAPVNTISILLAELAAFDCGERDAEFRELLGMGIDTARRMSALIEDVLDYTRVIGNEMSTEPVAIDAVIGGILTDLRADIHAAGATVRAGDLPVVAGSPMQLRALFQNLIANALKFRKPNAPPLITIAAENDRNGRHVRVIVADNGIGIAPENHARVFKLFQRLHVCNEYPGTGLGLALCQRIARNHGGHIDLASEFGRGAAFTVHLQGAPA